MNPLPAANPAPIAPFSAAPHREADWRLRVLATTRRSWADALASGRDGPSQARLAAGGQRPQAR